MEMIAKGKGGEKDFGGGEQRGFGIRSPAGRVELATASLRRECDCPRVDTRLQLDVGDQGHQHRDQIPVISVHKHRGQVDQRSEPFLTWSCGLHWVDETA